MGYYNKNIDYTFGIAVLCAIFLIVLAWAILPWGRTASKSPNRLDHVEQRLDRLEELHTEADSLGVEIRKLERWQEGGWDTDAPISTTPNPTSER